MSAVLNFLWPGISAHRTKTKTQTYFYLPAPALATYDFSRPPIVLITVPHDSTWSCGTHWHIIEAQREKVRCLAGPILLTTIRGTYSSGTTMGGPGISVYPRIWEALCWGRNTWTAGRSIDDLIVALEGRNESLHRNVCSAIIDASLIPYLASTPWWLGALFAALALIPRSGPKAREWLIAKLLWVQLHAIYYEHNYRTSEGMIYITWLWALQFGNQAPKWAAKFQWRSMQYISCCMGWSCYYLGRFALGMKGEYEEYTPRLIDEIGTSGMEKVGGDMARDAILEEKNEKQV